MVKLSQAALRMLERAGCTEVADDYIVLFNSEVAVLLSNKAVADLNRQARLADDLERAEVGIPTAACAATPADIHKGRHPLTDCAAASDGDCTHPDCPQLRDSEPAASGRHCPLDTNHEDD